MNFFTELAAISEGLDLTIRIKGKNGKLTVSVLPEAVDKVQPLITTGTPTELDEGFIDTIRKPLQDAGLVVVNQKEFDDSLKGAKQKSSKAETAAKPADKKKTDTKATKKTTEPKAAKPKQETPKKEELKQEGPKQLTIE